MGNPVLTFGPGVDNIFTFTEFAGLTNSLALHSGSKTEGLADDNAIPVPGAPHYTATFAYTPLPQILPGAIHVTTSTITGAGGTTGTVRFDFSVQDKQIDFLRQGQTLTQNILVTLHDSVDGGTTSQNIQVKITGANDKPTAHVDFQTISENVVLVKNHVLGNDTDPDLGDIKALTAGGFQVYSVTSAADPWLSKAMVTAARVNFTNNALPVKDSIQVALNKAFQGLTTGENALIVIKYGMVDGFHATSASELRLTVIGSPDAQIVGTSGNDVFLYGEKDADQIFGLDGNDTVFPRGGNDTVYLGAGFDTLVFNTPLSSTANRDTVVDFNPVQDTIKLENAIFTKLVAVGVLNPAFFWNGAAAHDANDYIVYDRPTGALYYDINGSGAGGAVQFATIANHAVLTHSDFVVM